MNFGRKLMALVTVFLMVFGSMPLTALADDTYPYVYKGSNSYLSTITDTDDTMHYTAVINLLNEPTGSTVHTFCADIWHVIKNEHFRTENMGSGSVADHVRAIMYAERNVGDAATAQAVQAAIWHFTDGIDLNTTTVDATTAALYTDLINLGGKGPVDATSPATVTVQNIGVAGYTDTTVDLTFRFKASRNIDLTPEASTGTLGPVTDGTGDNDGWKVVTVSGIPMNADFTLKVSGPQTISYDCMYFIPESGGSDAPGQKLAGFPLDSTITVSDTATVQFGSLRLKKDFTDPADATDHGEHFEATVTGGPGNSVNRTVSLPGNGDWVTVSGLPYGNYTVKENLTDGQKNRYNLKAITSSGTVTVSGPTQDVTVTNCELGSITVAKVLSEGANTDFSFNIKGNGFGADGKTFTLRGGDTTNFDKLEYGTYVITEVPTPGYLLTGMTGGTYDESAHTCTVTVGGGGSRDVTVTATNKQYFRQVTFAKNVDNNSQDPTVFHLSIFKDGDTTAYKTVDVSVGNPQTLALPYGSYTVSEGDAADYNKIGFNPSNAFTVGLDNYIEPITITANNHRHTGIVKVIKQDKGTHAGIGGVEFTISRSATDFTSADQVVAVLTTDSDGTKVSGPILVGDYYIKETATPSTYLNDNATPKPITIVAGDTAIEANTYTFLDSPNIGSLTIQKIDSYSHQGIEHVQFQVGKDENFTSLVTPLPNDGWTDANGMLVVLDLQPGQYWVREVTPKAGYELTSPATQGPITVYLNKSTEPVVFSDCPENKVRIIKLDSSDHNIKLYNVGFGIFDNKDCTGTPVAKLYTQANGEVTSDWLPFGGSSPTSYWIKELSMPDALKDRYVIDGAVQQVIFSTPGDTQTFTFYDARNFGSLTVAKALDSDAGDSTPFHFTISGPSYPVSDYPTGYAFDLTGNTSKNFPELIFGTYTITEQATPGYELTGLSGGSGAVSGSTITVELNAGNQSFTVTASNRKLGSIQISKAMQGPTSGTIQPFAFTITSDKLASPVTFNLDASGAGATYKLANLEYGTYTITETSRAEFKLIGFTGGAGTRSGNSYTVTVGTGVSRDLQITCANQELGKLQISKQDKDSHAWLGGAMFRVTQIATGTQFTLTTADADDSATGLVKGVATSDWIVPGDYTVQEIQAPDGYHIDDSTARPVTVMPGETTTLGLSFTDSVYEGSITVTKRDAQHPETTLPGVTFQCSSDPSFDTSKAAVYEQTTGADGTTTFLHLTVGVTYYVRETHQAAGYDIDVTDVKNVTVVFNTSMPLEFRNNELGNIQFIKQDTDSFAPVAGAEFAISSKGGADFEANIIQRLTTDSTGYTPVSQDLVVGNYWVAETSAPTGYANDNATPWQVSVPFKEVLSVGPRYDHRTYGYIEVVKYNDDKTVLLDGAKFEIKDSSNTVVDTLTTGSEAAGKAISRALPFGTYTLTETQAPTGYGITFTPVSVTVDTDGHVYSYDVTDKQLFGYIEVVKYNDDKTTLLDGAKFEITDSTGAVVDTLTTGSEAAGKAKSRALAFGTYTLTETQAPTGYGITFTPVSVTVDTDGHVYSYDVTDKQLFGYIEVAKYNDDKTVLLNGAKFEIRNSAGTVVDTLTTGDEAPGRAKSRALPFGDYSLMETQAPAGYAITFLPTGVRIDMDGHVYSYDVTDKQLLGYIQVTKFNDDKTLLLAGAKFEIKDSSNAVVDTLTTGDAGPGMAKSRALPLGTYTLTETQAPYGYGITFTPVTVTIDTDGHVYTYDATDKRLLGYIEVAKYNDDKSKLLDGAKFEIRDSSNTLVDTLTTGSEAAGKAKSRALPFGTYTLTETQAPAGYAITFTPVSVKVDTDGHVYSYDVTDKQLLGKIQVVKEDSVTSEKLNGAEFSVSTVSDPATFSEHIVTKITADASGDYISGNLPIGTYYLKETKAPDGYAIDDSTIYAVTVSADEVNSTLLPFKDTVYEASITVTKLDAQHPDTTVPGVTFQCSSDPDFDSSKTAVYEQATGADGTTTFLHLSVGVTYYVRETASVFGYEVTSTDAQFIAVAFESANALTFSDNEVGNIQFQKLDADNFNAVAGAEFAISSQGGADFEANIIQRLTTDSTSFTPVSQDLPVGQYWVAETGAPAGYQNNNATPVEITVGMGETFAAGPYYDHQQYGSAKFTKQVDNVDNDSTEFTLDISGDNGYTNQVTVGEMLPEAVLNDLPLGHYTVTEEGTTGYALVGITPSTFDVTAENYASTVTAVAVVNHKELGSAKFTKQVDNVDNDATEFTLDISGDNGYTNQVTVGEMLPAAELKDLPLGHYTVTEESTTGYALVSITPSTFDVTAENYASTVTAVAVVNHAQLGSAKFTKQVDNVDNDTTAFTLDISGDNGYTNTVTVGEMLPAAELKDLPLGHYTVTEEGTTGYALVGITPSTFDVTVENYASTVTAVAVVNHKELGSAKFTKQVDNVDNDATEFTLDISGDNGYTNKVTVGEMLPEAKLADLPLGHYTVTEESTTGYALVGITPSTFDVTAGNYASTVTAVAVVNHKEFGSAKFTKQVDNVDNDATEFTLDISGDNGYTNKVTVGEMLPEAKLADLPLGHYTVTEESTTGYALVGITPSTFDVTAENYASTVTAVAVVNHKEFGSAKFTKQVDNVDNDATEFTLDISGDNGYTNKVTVGEMLPDAILNDLPLGHYTVTEESTTGYALVSITPSTFDVTAGNYASTVTAVAVVNHQSPGQVLVKKLSYYDNSPINNVFFQLLYAKPAADGTIDASNIGPTEHTNASGIATFNGLVVGQHYWVREVKQADNYDIDTLLVKEVVAALAFDATDAPVFQDHPLGYVSLIKYDASTVNNNSETPYKEATKVAGAVYGVYDNSDCAGTPVTTVTTSVSGSVVSAALPFGADKPATYWVKEMAPAPAGYVLSDSVQFVTFTTPGQVASLTFQDSPLGRLQVKKVDALNPDTTALDGASFKLFNNADCAAEHQVDVEKTTGDGGNKGIVEFDNLTPGATYWILETKAPTDYKLPDPTNPANAISVTVESGLTVFTVQDEYNPPHPYPPTGTMDWNFLVIGAVALLAGALLIIVTRKRKVTRVGTHVR